MKNVIGGLEPERKFLFDLGQMQGVRESEFSASARSSHAAPTLECGTDLVKLRWREAMSYEPAAVLQNVFEQQLHARSISAVQRCALIKRHHGVASDLGHRAHQM